MLFQWLKRLKGAIRSVRKPSRRPRPARPLPLRLEELETRLVPATTLTWTGAAHHNLWSQDANWSATGGPDKHPGAGDTLIFQDGASQPSNQNDIQNLTLASIQFTRAGGGYDLLGNGISLTGGITASSATGFDVSAVDTVEFPITLTQAQSFEVDGKRLALALNGGVNVPISSGASWTVIGPGTVALGGSSTILADVDVQAGALQVNGSLAYNQGVLTVEHNATLTDAGSVTTTSASQVDDHGQITVAAAANGQAAGSMSLQGSMTVESDGALTDAGSVTVAAKNPLEDHGALTVSPGGTLDDQSSIKVESGAKLDDAGTLTIEPATPAASLDDAGSLAVESSGILNDGGALTVEQTGTLTDAGSVNVGFKTNSGSISHPGTLLDHGQVTVEGPGANGQAAGALLVSGSGSNLTVESVGTLTDAGAVAVGKAGVLDDAHLVTVGPGGTLDDASVVTVESGSALDDGGALTVEGLTFGTGRANLTSHGTLEVEAGQTVNVSGNVVLAGTSQQPAILAATLTGAATPVIALQPGGTLALDTTGTTELNLSAAADFAPAPGQQFTLIANASGQAVQGFFDDTNGKPINEGDPVPVGAFGFTITYLGGHGSQDIVLTSLATQFTIGIVSHLSVPVVVVTPDGQMLPATGSLQLSPGTYALADPNGVGASVPFAVTPAGAVDYDPSLDGILSGRGASTLIVNGRTVGIDTSALSISALTLDRTLTLPRTLAVVYSFTALPGTYSLVDSAGSGASVQFMLNADGTVAYDQKSLQGVLLGAGGNELIVQGVAVLIEAQALFFQFIPPLVTSIIVDGQAPSTQAIQTVFLLPGAFSIQYTTSTGLNVIVNFTVSAQDVVTYVSDNQNLPGEPLGEAFGNTVFLPPPL
jgi:hypothetical protein